MNYTFDELICFVQREGIEDLKKHLEEIGYFNSPASTQYHLAEDRGLLKHSVNVTNTMLKLKSSMDLDDISIETIVIVGLFHDIGKAGYYGKPNYVENILKSGKRSDAKPFEVNKEILAVPHEVSAIHILTNFIKLTEEEVFAILYHNGLYTSIGYQLKGNERELQTVLHFADLYCSRFIEK